MAQPLPGQRIADCLKLEFGLAMVFWLPYALPASVFDTPYLGTAWLALWLACPLLTGVGLLTLPRDSQLRWGWPQILLAATLAGSILWRFATAKF